MAEHDRDPGRGPSQPAPDETREEERQRVRSSNDRDQELEREGVVTKHNRGYDEAVRKPRDVDDQPPAADRQGDR